MASNLSSLPLYSVLLVRIEVNVELTVPQVDRILLLLDVAELSSPISIMSLYEDFDFGTHRVLPLLAIICSKIFVAID